MHAQGLAVDADALVAAGIAERPYDALLDAYEPGTTVTIVKWKRL